MTGACFQSSLAKLVATGSIAGDDAGTLSDREKLRLADIAGQNGRDVMQTLYFSWRLTKVLSLLPLTTRLLGETTSAFHLRRFWQRRTAKSLYFVEECLAFLEFLEDDIEERPAFFADVTGFERARLRLRDDQSKGRPCHPCEVRFRCHPDALMSALMSGKDVTKLLPADIVLCGALSEDGEEQWLPIAPSFDEAWIS